MCGFLPLFFFSLFFGGLGPAILPVGLPLLPGGSPYHGIRTEKFRPFLAGEAMSPCPSIYSVECCFALCVALLTSYVVPAPLLLGRSGCFAPPRSLRGGGRDLHSGITNLISVILRMPSVGSQGAHTCVCSLVGAEVRVCTCFYRTMWWFGFKFICYML